jgi:hypothetical protein
LKPDSISAEARPRYPTTLILCEFDLAATGSETLELAEPGDYIAFLVMQGDLGGSGHTMGIRVNPLLSILLDHEGGATCLSSSFKFHCDEKKALAGLFEGLRGSCKDGRGGSKQDSKECDSEAVHVRWGFSVSAKIMKEGRDIRGVSHGVFCVPDVKQTTIRVAMVQFFGVSSYLPSHQMAETEASLFSEAKFGRNGPFYGVSGKGVRTFSKLNGFE